MDYTEEPTTYLLWDSSWGVPPQDRQTMNAFAEWFGQRQEVSRQQARTQLLTSSSTELRKAIAALVQLSAKEDNLYKEDLLQISKYLSGTLTLLQALRISGLPTPPDGATSEGM